MSAPGAAAGGDAGGDDAAGGEDNADGIDNADDADGDGSLALDSKAAPAAGRWKAMFGELCSNLGG